MEKQIFLSAYEVSITNRNIPFPLFLTLKRLWNSLSRAHCKWSPMTDTASIQHVRYQGYTACPNDTETLAYVTVSQKTVFFSYEGEISSRWKRISSVRPVA